ncbi:MAG: phosphatidate cytidylyltransferase [Rhodospirillaceae bacterium]|nr:phosphatidate cytidylyltransferase [Rhodospirillaceae bacterium]
MRGWFDLDTRLAIAVGGIFGLLVLGSLIIWALKRARPERNYTELVQRTKSWWVMAAIFTAALLFDRVAGLAFLGVVSFLALKEYLSIIPTRRADRRVLFFLYLAIPIQYYWVSIGWYGMFIIFVPVYMLLFLPLPMLVIGQTQGFLRAVGTLHWGLMMTVFSLSHAAYALMLPAAPNAMGDWRDPYTGAALMLYLVVLTQLNDVAQYVWGKLLGRHKIIPAISPNKTWEGFVGGVVTSAVLSGALGPWLTPIDWRGAAILGALLGVAGFVGDVTVSALKRDLGLKDTSQFLPGHGGVLDRIDSLTYTAPIFLHYVRYFYY